MSQRQNMMPALWMSGEKCCVPQSREGLYQYIVEAMEEFEQTEVIVGIELTGHYWLNPLTFLTTRAFLS